MDIDKLSSNKTTVDIKYSEVVPGDILMFKTPAKVVAINLWGKKTPASVHEIILNNGDIYCGWGERILKKVVDK